MRVLACIKQIRVLDDAIVFADGEREVDPDVLEPGLNEWDSYAIEAALRIREEDGGEVVAATAGEAEAEEVLRRALAMGVDHAIRIEGCAPDPYIVGSALASVVRRLSPDLILCGAQSSDAAHGATGAVVAGLLDLPCAAVVNAICVDHARQEVEVDRELEGGVRDRLRLPLPAVLTVQTGINQPRYANLRAIKLAERQPIEVILREDGGEPAYRIRKMSVPTAEGRAQTLGGDVREAAELVAKLIRERAS